MNSVLRGLLLRPLELRPGLSIRTKPLIHEEGTACPSSAVKFVLEASPALDLFKFFEKGIRFCGYLNVSSDCIDLVCKTVIVLYTFLKVSDLFSLFERLEVR